MQKKPLGLVLRTSGEERGAAPGDWEIPGVAPAVGGAGGVRRRGGSHLGARGVPALACTAEVVVARVGGSRSTCP